MLPPDTSSNLLPWRVVVPLMQLCGGFPYRMSATSSPPAFSLPLCLWGIFEQVLQVSMNSMSFSTMFFIHFTQDIGTAIYICTSLVMMVTLCSAPVLMAVHSSTLAALLHDMSVMKGVSPPPSHRWCSKPQTLAILSGILPFTVFSTYSSSTLMGLSHFVEVTLVAPVCFFSVVSFLLPVELPSMVFGLLARRLVVATEATVATVSTLLALDGSFTCESDVEAAMLALRDLDAVILEVEEQRETGTHCFFPVVSMYLIMAVLLVIACPYVYMKGILVGGSVLSSFLIAYYIVGRFCYLGQAFVRQVSTAERLLKNLRAKSQSLSFNLKVTQVMGSLSSMLTFDMRGWYRLDYASFVTLVNTILTYEVIIFQVGGKAISKASSSAKSNSSATA